MNFLIEIVGKTCILAVIVSLTIKFVLDVFEP